jgi:ubiquinone/menaquinone biosynthesis C-methylase UbiE
LIQNPATILSPYVKPGMTVLDIGCGMGFFTLDMAKLVGSGGRVVAIDLQQRMIDALRRRAATAKLSERIDSRICTGENLGADDLKGRVDFAAAFFVVHEVPDANAFIREVHLLVAPGGTFFVLEPEGRVTVSGFEDMIARANEAGFSLIERPRVRRSRSAVFRRD